VEGEDVKLEGLLFPQLLVADVVGLEEVLLLLLSQVGSY